MVIGKKNKIVLFENGWSNSDAEIVAEGLVWRFIYPACKKK